MLHHAVGKISTHDVAARKRTPAVRTMPARETVIPADFHQFRNVNIFEQGTVVELRQRIEVQAAMVETPRLPRLLMVRKPLMVKFIQKIVGEL
ncbi:hypothetical protein SDC9_169199 [bioreactor metagenome]|uniref:Uncharacterized protein n=1 Tax=bioreactor metagenome TaxID=1076179 RepID=A0A645G4I9_9ZZZZ